MLAVPILSTAKNDKVSRIHFRSAKGSGSAEPWLGSPEPRKEKGPRTKGKEPCQETDSGRYGLDIDFVFAYLTASTTPVFSRLVGQNCSPQFCLAELHPKLVQISKPQMKCQQSFPWFIVPTHPRKENSSIFGRKKKSSAFWNHWEAATQVNLFVVVVFDFTKKRIKFCYLSFLNQNNEDELLLSLTKLSAELTREFHLAPQLTTLSNVAGASRRKWKPGENGTPVGETYYPRRMTLSWSRQRSIISMNHQRLGGRRIPRSMTLTRINGCRR